MKSASLDTKKKLVCAHLWNKGSIDTWEANKLYNATRLSALIFSLKKDGWVFGTDTHGNYHGTPYAVYNLIADPLFNRTVDETGNVKMTRREQSTIEDYSVRYFHEDLKKAIESQGVKISKEKVQLIIKELKQTWKIKK